MKNEISVTTNKDLIPKIDNNQLSLFEMGGKHD